MMTLNCQKTCTIIDIIVFHAEMTDTTKEKGIRALEMMVWVKIRVFFFNLFKRYMTVQSKL